MVHRATGRLWEDHLGHLGYQSSFYRFQDTLLTHNSNSITNSGPPNHQNLSTIVFGFETVFSSTTTKKTPAAMFGDQTEHVHPPKPSFLIKSKKNKMIGHFVNILILSNILIPESDFNACSSSQSHTNPS